MVVLLQMFASDPVHNVWGVLGESGGCGGGGCGGGGCGGGGCGGGGCGGGGCAGGCGSGGGGRSSSGPVPTNFSLIESGAGCGTGNHVAACGAGNRDPTDIRPVTSTRYPRKMIITLQDSPRLKCVCDIDIIPVCLNRHNLEPLPVGDYVVRSTYETSYQ
jgi:hypothetical protein